MKELKSQVCGMHDLTNIKSMCFVCTMSFLYIPCLYDLYLFTTLILIHYSSNIYIYMNAKTWFCGVTGVNIMLCNPRVVMGSMF